MLVAFVAPLASFRIRSLRVPAILIEILLGMVLGKSGLQIVEADAVIDYLAEFGFVFLMFLSGFELDFGPSGGGRGGRLRPWVQPGLLFAATLLMSLLAAELMHQAGLIREPLLFALILSTTSVGVVLPTLKERGEVRSRYGQALVRAALVADLSTILLLTLFVLHAHHDSAGQAALPGLLAVAFLVVLVAGRRLGRVPLLGRMLDELDHASTQIKVRGGLAVLVLFIVLAESLGAEAILSAFLAGLLVTLLAGDSRETLGHKLDAIGYGFFIPVFFVMVGVDVDVPGLVADPRALLLVPLLVAVALVVKLAPSLLILRGFGLRHGLAGGFLLSSRLALIIAASSVALELGAIDVTVNTAVVLTAIITCLLSPMLYGRTLGTPVVGRARVVVGGAGRVGRRLVRRLAAHDVDLVVVDVDGSQEARLDVGSARFVLGDLRDPAVLADACGEGAEVFVSLAGDDDVNLDACLSARDRFGVARVVARNGRPSNAARFQAVGVVPLHQATAVATAAENLVLRPTLAQLLLDASGELFAFEVRCEGGDLAGQRLHDLTFLGDALVVVVQRSGDRFTPHGHTRIEAGDSLVFMGSAADESRIRAAFSGADRGDGGAAVVVPGVGQPPVAT